MPDDAEMATQFAQLFVTHKATRPLQELTPLSICEWAWQSNLITFVEMLALIEWLRETGKVVA